MSAPPLPPLPRLDQPPLPVFPGRTTSAGGYRVFVRRTPVRAGAEPALYVHGLGGASTNWTDLMYLLAPRLAGEALDLPGFGWSDPPPRGDYSLDGHVAAVRAVIEAREQGPVHLFGNSLGGAVATRLTAERPDLVRTLTLIAPALPTYRPPRGSPLLPLLLVPGLERLLSRRMAAASAEDRVRAVIEMCYANPARARPERLAEAIVEFQRRNGLGHASDALVGSLRGLVAAYFMAGSRGLWRQAASVRAPTLVVFGRQDRLVHVRMASRAARAFRRAKVVVHEDAGHVAQLEWPQNIAEAVLDHLGDVCSAGGPADGSS